MTRRHQTAPFCRIAGHRFSLRLVWALAGLAMTAGTARELAAETKTADQGRPPNIVIIVADDQGYADLGVQGCKDIPTPHIDSLAANGVRFTNGYVSCPVCSPTRAGLQTGRYQQRFGHELNPGPPQSAEPDFGLPLTEITLADRLKAAGYITGIVGKWHLGYNPPFHPLKRGYDEFFGFLAGSHDYFAEGDRGPIMRGTEPLAEKEYLTDAFGREAAAFIERHKQKPFMLMLTFNAIHTPMQYPQKYLDRFKSIDDPLRQKTAAMLNAMDDNVGRVLKTLRECGIEKDTLIFYISDNGGPTPTNGSRNTPLRGTKGQVWEGGIRVPFLVQWKGRIPSGKVYEKPVISLDIHPTCLAASGGKFDIPKDKALDGVNLLPYVNGENKGNPHEVLFWRYGSHAAIRKGDYKLVRTAQGEGLYDLAADIAEENDLKDRKPEVVRALRDTYDKWSSQMIAPAWGRPGTQGGIQPRQEGPARAAGKKKTQKQAE